MKILVGYSRCPHTRAAFEARGHDVWTCDLRAVDHPKHYCGDVWEILGEMWDLLILHPPCTYLTVSAAWAAKDPDFERYPNVGYHQRVSPETLTGSARREAMAEAVENFKRLEQLPFPTAIENPAPSMLSKRHRPPDQIIQPYQFGDDASKGTGLWLRGVPPLEILPAHLHASPRMANGRPRWANQTDSGQNKLPPSPDRWAIRSNTYPGIAAAMANQWRDDTIQPFLPLAERSNTP